MDNLVDCMVKAGGQMEGEGRLGVVRQVVVQMVTLRARFHSSTHLPPSPLPHFTSLPSPSPSPLMQSPCEPSLSCPPQFPLPHPLNHPLCPRPRLAL
ncbi:hypothetical protein Pcinc_030463 [Petrolisthes cinctipes]|uniref:Uncharacterized protein n=1 Tax=Petrolisthes cinctipes TaxID=88211 RepID=A0AAE1EY29_PETCI|nr:hypothetical protein Pcinc_030463 [Petrolisthes cinctipes]